MNKTISVAEARKNLAEIMDEVKQGKQTYSIVRYGKEIARLVPPHSTEIDASLEKDLKEFVSTHSEALAELANR